MKKILVTTSFSEVVYHPALARVCRILVDEGLCPIAPGLEYLVVFGGLRTDADKTVAAQCLKTWARVADESWIFGPLRSDGGVGYDLVADGGGDIGSFRLIESWDGLRQAAREVR